MNLASFTLTTLVHTLMLTPAFAWQSSAEGPDIFGKTVAIATSEGDKESLVVQCDSDGQLSVAFIFAIKKYDDV